MELDITWAGPPIDDQQTLRKLPSDLAKLLKSVNGFIQFGGALHLRGVCRTPEWHSLLHAWESTDAFYRHYRTVKKSDVPFAQSALGDQYFIRDNIVHRLDTECDEIESLNMDFKTFLEEVQRDPIAALNLEPLEEFWDHVDEFVKSEGCDHTTRFASRWAEEIVGDFCRLRNRNGTAANKPMRK